MQQMGVEGGRARGGSGEMEEVILISSSNMYMFLYVHV